MFLLRSHNKISKIMVSNNVNLVQCVFTFPFYQCCLSVGPIALDEAVVGVRNSVKGNRRRCDGERFHHREPFFLHGSCVDSFWPFTFTGSLHSQPSPFHSNASR